MAGPRFVVNKWTACIGRQWQWRQLRDLRGVRNRCRNAFPRNGRIMDE
jgi:hypothetical protein